MMCTRSTTIPRMRKMLGNSVPLNRKRSKLSKFCSEAFCGRENSSEFRSVRKTRKLLKFCSGAFYERETARNSIAWSKSSKFSKFCMLTVLPPLFKINFWKLLGQFRAFPSFEIDSSVNFGMPRNEHFLPGNNKNGSASIRGIVSEPNSGANPTNKRSKMTTTIPTCSMVRSTRESPVPSTIPYKDCAWQKITSSVL
jgi:hypothetical protein